MKPTIIKNIFWRNQQFFLFQRSQAFREGYFLHHNNLYIQIWKEKHAFSAVIEIFSVSFFQWHECDEYLDDSFRKVSHSKMLQRVHQVWLCLCFLIKNFKTSPAWFMLLYVMNSLLALKLKSWITFLHRLPSGYFFWINRGVQTLFLHPSMKIWRRCALFRFYKNTSSQKLPKWPKVTFQPLIRSHLNRQEIMNKNLL